MLVPNAACARELLLSISRQPIRRRRVTWARSRRLPSRDVSLPEIISNRAPLAGGADEGPPLGAATGTISSFQVEKLILYAELYKLPEAVPAVQAGTFSFGGGQ